MKSLTSRRTITAMTLAFALALAPLAGAQTGVSAGNSELSGRVLGADGKPAAGVVVIVYHLSSERTFRSEPTNAKGEYLITGLPYGYLDVAVQGKDGLYPSDQVVNVPPSGKSVLSLTLVTGTASAEPRDFPGAEGVTVGSANVLQKLAGRDFWRSPKGVGVIAGIGGAALLAIAGGGDERRASPF